IEANGRMNSSNSEAAISAMGENSSEKPPELLHVKIPTATKAQKRKHIQTNFDNSLLLSQPALDAQRKEKERLERLERQKQSLGENGHIEQVAAMMPKPVTPLPVLDAFDPEVICLIGDDSDPGLDSKKKIPPLIRNAPKAEPEVIELSSGDEDEKYDGRASSSFTPYRVVPPLPSGFDYGKRSRWMYSDKDKADHEKMERQHKMEKERMRKRRNSHELEKIELTQTGRLLVNAGKFLGGGVSKVITFIEVFLRVTEAKKVLVIVPINTIQNWYNEFEKWIPRYSEKGELCRQFEVFLLGDSVKTFDQRVNLIEEWTRKGGVLLIGYEMFRLLIRSTQPKKPAKPKNNSVYPPQPERTVKPDDFDQGFTADGRVKKEANDIIRGALIDPGADLVVCDEGHKIKNLNTDIALALGAIKTRRRIVLTGYPLQNNLMEYYCMVDFVRPDYLGSRKTFSIQFEKPIKNGQCIDSTATSSTAPSILEQTLQSNLSDPSRVTHSELWSGIFATGPPASLGTKAEPKRADESPRSSSKMRRSTRLKPKTIQGVMEEEFDITENDQGLQYDWAEVAMASYKTGNIEHGYKMVIALELLDACVRIGEKMLIFRYGQQRRTFIYRLILNNCMEKAIFNRQISKHGLQQRVVDEAQVDANITQKELETLLMYDESLDVIHKKWDTSQWDFGDEVLESVVKNRSEMLAEEPFLHESLMLEREEGLSEEEKKEAELWFTKEQYKDVSAQVTVSLNGGYPMGYAHPNENGNEGGMVGLNRMFNPMEGPRRVPPFPGAAVAFEAASNSRGSVQLIRTDRVPNRAPPLITLPPDPPRPLRLPPPLNPVPDVIELD
ncbi:protein, SNF2 family, partial [Teladorsagia circumcincta]